jgi:RNA polymerase sigma-70 factor, ECF subfamily
MLLALLSAIFRSDQDSALAQRLRSREPEAVAELYDLYGKVTYSVILRVVRRTETAQDLTQEVFLRAWTRIHQFDPEKGSLYTWLLTIARRQAIDYVRSVDARVAQTTKELNRDHVAPSDVERDALNADAARRVRVALDRLEPQKRQLLELAYFEGLSQTEMAERTQLPLGTVKTWVRSALRELREAIGNPALNERPLGEGA